MTWLPQGVWPVMLTPFRSDRAIDFDALDRLIDWYLAADVAGLFACCLSSEVYHLDPREQDRLAQRTLRHVDGRSPVVVGVLGMPDDASRSEAARRYVDAGAAAVVLNVAELAAEGAGDGEIQRGFEAFLKASPGVPVGLYECPKPHHRLLSPELLAACAETGRLRFLKDTSCNEAALRVKADAVAGTGVRLLNAHTPSLLESLRTGGDGFCGLGANFIPELYVWLCRAYRDEPALAARVQRFLAACDPTIHRRYPASAKWLLNDRGIAMETLCRSADVAMSDDDAEAIRAMAAAAEELRALLPIEPTHAARPATVGARA